MPMHFCTRFVLNSLTVLTLLLLPTEARPDPLTITVSGIAPEAKGMGHFALYNSATAYDARQPVMTARRPMTNGVCTWVHHDFPEGQYVISFYADLNGNGRLDRTAIGIPREPVAFSNNSRPRFGPPRYKSMAFTHQSEPTRQNLTAFRALGKRGRFGLGFAVLANQSPYDEDSARTIAIPMITYMGDRFSITGPMASLLLATPGPTTIRARVRYSFEGFDTDESNRLEGMHSRNDTIMGGLALSWEPVDGKIEFELDIESDLLDEHGGRHATASVGYTLRLADVSIEPQIGVEWLSSTMADHLYGVRPTEARTDRPAYDPGDSFSLIIGTGVRYSLTEKIALIANGSWTRFDAVIQDSPIVAKDSVFSIFAAVAYSL